MRRSFGLSITNFAIGFVAAALIAISGYRAHALTGTGAIAAFIVGTLTFGCGGLAFAVVLLFFFLSSVLLGRIGLARKTALVDLDKTGPRDAWQVLANGGVATACICVAAGFSHLGYGAGGSGWIEYPALSFDGQRLVSPAVWLTAFCGAYAAATADTWGTEIGTLARQLPRSILTFRPVAAGLSGGISAAGTVAEVAGALFVAIVSLFSFIFAAGGMGLGLAPGRVATAIVVAGIGGALLDSFLGATVQELRRCPSCKRTCETNPHVCGTPTTLVRGIRGFSNDLVNFTATLAGAGTAFILAVV